MECIETIEGCSYGTVGWFSLCSVYSGVGSIRRSVSCHVYLVISAFVSGCALFSVRNVDKILMSGFLASLWCTYSQ